MKVFFKKYGYFGVFGIVVTMLAWFFPDTGVSLRKSFIADFSSCPWGFIFLFLIIILMLWNLYKKRP
ncbi:hypothetical protein [Peribacillus frigoritolerans]|uniref:hypothetical protein n=1 Tax=Peribacillus frigoritolerans TaxID=450367 RepID=UPI0024C12363|nr:hypothetical protein [Peribacillus frigoritolerans]WHX59887.1 hypothetical protein QNH33_14635 [Peribacillus frigoritolerans]